LEKIILPFSGGIDSSVAAAFLKSKSCEVFPLFFNHHQGPLAAERRAAINLACKLDIQKPLEIEVNLDKLKSLNSEWLRLNIGTPARNMIFLSIATMYAGITGANAIALATAYGSTFPDTSYAFLESVEKVSRHALDRPIRVFSPFKEQKWTSSDVVRQGTKLGVPLHQTWSCFLPRDMQCGKCIKCIDRKERFHVSGTVDKTKYSDKGVTQKDLEEALRYV
jgi:7-cyano-7-deazaguanine synthase